MGFWTNTLSNVLGGIGAGLFFALMYVLIQWFLQATDLVVSYNWHFDTKDGIVSFHPNFEIRNRSRSKFYRLWNIAYMRDGQRVWFDNKSLLGKVLEPASVNYYSEEIAPVKNAEVEGIGLVAAVFGIEVTVRTQTGRAFWLRGEGPGKMGKGRIRRAAFSLRAKLESWMISME
jgi:hypothetical protein